MNKEVENMPKVVQHLHLDGSLRPETVKEWIEEMLGKKVDIEVVKKLLMVDKDCKDLNQYLEKFDTPMKVLQTAEHLERATFELYEDLANQNVVYAEVRFAPSKHLMGGLSYDEVVTAVIKGMNRAKEQYGIDGNIILCCMRGSGEQNKEENFATVETAKKFLGKGVGALDLAGAEAIFTTDNFEDVFKKAKEYNIPYTIHAGEADGPKSINTALDYGAKRIGHGVRCIEDEKTMKRVKELGESEGLVLEVCPISNLQTQAVEGKHPLEKIYRYGIKTTINTDNNTVSSTNILDEYNWVLDNTNLTTSDLAKMNEYACRSIFGTPEQKRKIQQKLDEYNREENAGERE